MQPIRYTYRVVRKDGSIRHWDDHGSPAVGELSYGIAHDFYSSLQSIIGTIDGELLRHVPGALRDELETIKESALDATSRIRHLQRLAGNHNDEKERE